jgi:uncharacterized membrane protein (DUF485 family)
MQDQASSSGMTPPVQVPNQMPPRMAGVSETLVITSTCVGFVIVALLIVLTAVYIRRQRMRKLQSAVASTEV